MITVSEDEHQGRIVDLLNTLGFIVFHPRKAQVKDSWATAVKYQGVGFPDLVAVHPEKGIVLVIEVKAEAGRMSDDQAMWAAAWTQADEANQNVWYIVAKPRDWELLQAWLLAL